LGGVGPSLYLAGGGGVLGGGGGGGAAHGMKRPGKTRPVENRSSTTCPRCAVRTGRTNICTNMPSLRVLKSCPDTKARADLDPGRLFALAQALVCLEFVLPQCAAARRYAKGSTATAYQCVTAGEDSSLGGSTVWNL